MEIPKEEQFIKQEKEKDAVDKYQEELAAFIVKELEGDKKLLRRLLTKLVGTHHHGENLIDSLRADNKFENLAGKVLEFQRKWEEEHKNWTYSCLVWENVQWLGEKLSELYKKEFKTKSGILPTDPENPPKTQKSI